MRVLALALLLALASARSTINTIQRDEGYTVDIVGYYGNSGAAVASIPTMDGIHPGYNVVILTFGTWVPLMGPLLDIQGPYRESAFVQNNFTKLAADIKAWKGVPDKWGRQKYALVSIGGANGLWPATMSTADIETFENFMANLNVDGLDIDLEYGSVAASLKSLAPVIRNLTARGKVVTAAPLAATQYLNFYKSTSPLLSWVQPQFYNTAPAFIAPPYQPDFPMPSQDWQAESSGGRVYWAGVLDAIAKADGLTKTQLGMLMPMYGANWDIAKHARQVKASGVGHVGTWAIAYDHQQGWKLAEALTALMDPPRPTAPSAKPSTPKSPSTSPHVAMGDAVCCYTGGCTASASCNAPGSYCSQSEDNCAGCGGTWCPGGQPTPPPPTPAPPPPPPPSPPSPGSGYPGDKLRFAGRWYKGSDSAMVAGWGQSVFAKFTGSAKVGVNVNGGGLYYSYRVDGGPWTKATAGHSTVMLANNLAEKDEHTLHFGRSDEASYGTWTFYDLVLDQGYTALDPDAPKLTYEAIGDSITAGFKVDCQPGGGSPSTGNEDAYKTYVAHLGDAWGTNDWSIIARSGIGVGPVSGAGGTMLEEYKCQVYSGSSCGYSPKWDFSKERRQPDVITVNLGTNDFAFGNPSLATFQNNYKVFVSFVRSVHPRATIFCICPLQYSLNGPLSLDNVGGPLGRDKKWETMMKPEARDKKWLVMRDGVEGAVKELGDSKIIYIATSTPDAPWMDGATEFSDWTHPTVKGHDHFAKLLEPLLTPIVQRNHPFAFPSSSASGLLVV